MPFSVRFVTIVIVVVGVWDVMSNERVVDYVRTRIAQNMRPAEVRQCEVHLDQ